MKGWVMILFAVAAVILVKNLTGTGGNIFSGLTSQRGTQGTDTGLYGSPSQPSTPPLYGGS